MLTINLKSLIILFILGNIIYLYILYINTRARYDLKEGNI